MHLRYDKLYIYDGSSANDSTLGQAFYTGNEIPSNLQSVQSSGTDVFLHFTSDASNGGSGFAIHYEEGKFIIIEIRAYRHGILHDNMMPNKWLV